MSPQERSQLQQEHAQTNTAYFQQIQSIGHFGGQLKAFAERALTQDPTISRAQVDSLPIDAIRAAIDERDRLKKKLDEIDIQLSNP